MLVKLATAAVPLAALTSALVVQNPDFHQIPLSPGSEQPAGHDQADQAQWWDKLPSVESVKSSFTETANSLEALLDATVSTTKKLHDKVLSDVEEAIQQRPKHDKHPHYTVYEAINNNKYTTKFAELVNDFPDIVKLLNDTSKEVTLFVPGNSAFEHIPEDHEKPSKEIIESILLYHIVPGYKDAKKVLSSYTIATAYKEKFLGDEPQRLRPSLGLGGPKINFYSKIKYPNIPAKNGVIHAVNNILVPPPMVGQILTLLPTRYSTLLLAYEKTDFVKFVHKQKMTGSTVFVPSNRAWQSLGTAANAFLFNSKHGLKYLTALLKYQIVPDVTLYSDAIYDKTSDKDAVTLSEHHELSTLLDGASLGVDVAKVLGFIIIRVNGFIEVSIHDGLAKNGVIHEVSRIPLPPRKGHNEAADLDYSSDISVEELKERLADYI